MGATRVADIATADTGGIATTFPIGSALATSVFGVGRISVPVLAAVVLTLLVTGQPRR